VSRPKRSLGQNFLVDRSMARRIVEASGAEAGDVLLEIGPGRGALTRLLAPLGRPLVVLEKDDGLADGLETEWAAAATVQVVRGDAMKVDLDALPLGLDAAADEGRSVRIVANLPYNVASRIALRMLAWGRFVDATFTFQREVAIRFAAIPGSRDYGALSVMARVYTDPYLLFPIPPDAFRPRPRVMSHVVRFRMLAEPRVGADELHGFEQLVRGVFQTRRKTVLNSMTRLPWLDLGDGPCREALAEAGIDPGVRAENIALDQFLALSRAVARVHTQPPSG